MLMGIVKPKGEVVLLSEIESSLAISSRRCFEAGFLYGVNQTGDMIRFDPPSQTEIFVKDQAAEPVDDTNHPPADQDQAKPEPDLAAEPEQPAENVDRTGAGK